MEEEEEDVEDEEQEEHPDLFACRPCRHVEAETVAGYLLFLSP